MNFFLLGEVPYSSSTFHPWRTFARIKKSNLIPPRKTHDQIVLNLKLGVNFGEEPQHSQFPLEFELFSVNLGLMPYIIDEYATVNWSLAPEENYVLPQSCSGFVFVINSQKILSCLNKPGRLRSTLPVRVTICKRFISHKRLVLVFLADTYDRCITVRTFF